MNTETADIYEMLDKLSLPAAAQRFAELIVLNRQGDLNKYRKRIRHYARIQLLFIDDFAISRYSKEGIRILYHLIKLRDDLGTPHSSAVSMPRTNGATS